MRTFWNVASDDLKTASEVKSQELMYFWPQKEAMTMEWNGIGHSSCRDIILAWKIKQAFLHWIIKNIASFRYEAVEAVQGRQPKNWLSMHKSPLLRIPKMNGFCLECNFVLKKCWFEVWQIVFKHPVNYLINTLLIYFFLKKFLPSVLLSDMYYAFMVLR